MYLPILCQKGSTHNSPNLKSKVNNIIFTAFSPVCSYSIAISLIYCVRRDVFEQYLECPFKSLNAGSELFNVISQYPECCVSVTYAGLEFHTVWSLWIWYNLDFMN